MNPDYKDGYIKTNGDVICLYSPEGEYVQGLYNWKTRKFNELYNIAMPQAFQIPTLIEIPTRYLIHNSDIILTLP